MKPVGSPGEKLIVTGSVKSVICPTLIVAVAADPEHTCKDASGEVSVKLGCCEQS